MWSQFNTNIGGSVGNLAQGDKAQAINLGNITRAPANEQTEFLNRLTPESERLQEAMEKEKSEPEHEVEVGSVKAAAAAAKKAGGGHR